MAVISILEAAKLHGLPAYRFHRWIARGYLKRIAKVAGRGQAGEIILDAAAVAALVANPPKEGRPPGRKTGENSSKPGVPQT